MFALTSFEMLIFFKCLSSPISVFQDARRWLKSATFGCFQVVNKTYDLILFVCFVFFTSIVKVYKITVVL